MNEWRWMSDGDGVAEPGGHAGLLRRLSCLLAGRCCSPHFHGFPAEGKCAHLPSFVLILALNPLWIILLSPQPAKGHWPFACVMLSGKRRRGRWKRARSGERTPALCRLIDEERSGERREERWRQWKDDEKISWRDWRLQPLRFLLPAAQTQTSEGWDPLADPPLVIVLIRSQDLVGKDGNLQNFSH